ncbi:uncharacterized protein LOC110446026 [Mizuhopecten yessoensis]|uniref:Interleukin-17A n=1 Tax=Mizuhopecten yessoensis TaxID=6573 RepID=A0A210QY64_MIZYE|nr:uncharacterized protein LOC110446026 [Mizuhopecten yessoensis]OWF53697.1 Interleukin-17A [Mizuhopecten yessoensis]
MTLTFLRTNGINMMNTKAAVLLGFVTLQCITTYIAGQYTCDSQTTPPIFTKPFEDLRNETMAMISPEHRTSTTEGEVTRTAVLLDPRGSAFIEDRIRAVCPWSYVRNEDLDRIPRVIFEAKCIHSRCHGCHADRDASPLRRPMCSEVHYYAMVMRKMGCDETGRDQYERVLQKISAGCTCLRAAGSTMIHPVNGYPGGERTNP